MFKILLIFLLSSNSSLALNLEEAAHLLRRTEFGPSIEKMELILNKPKNTAVKSLFATANIYSKNSNYKKFIDLTLKYESSVKNLVKQYQKKQKPISKIDFQTQHKNLTKKYLKQVLTQFYTPPPMMSKKQHKKRMSKKLNKKRKRIFKDIDKYDIKHAFLISSRHFITVQTLQTWWIEEMINSPEPLREMMTLFWHNHFATSFSKIKDVPLMALQNHSLRENAFKPFGELLKVMSEDKALLLYLDAEHNHKNHPNENFARELMELFTLGIGHYTEKDIKSTARALTGFMPLFNKANSRIFIFDSNAQDKGSKTILGQTGHFNKKDIINILLKQKQTARHIVYKLWLYFISPQPDETLITQWTDSFYKSNYDTKALLLTLFSSSAFYNSKAKLIKAPVDYIVGTLKSFNIKTKLSPIGPKMNKMGQALFAPPNVSGWSGYTEKGYKEWITSTSVPKRQNLLRAILSKDLNTEDWIKWLKKHNKNTVEDNFIKIFFALPPIEKNHKAKKKTKHKIWLKQRLLDASYQLK